jgi:hypothetical protein
MVWFIDKISVIWVFQHMPLQSFAHRFQIANDVTRVYNILYMKIFVRDVE